MTTSRIAALFLWLAIVALNQADSGDACKPTTVPEMKYPPLGTASGMSGEVRLRATIKDDGRIGAVITLSGRPLLVNAAKKNLKTWEFSPDCAGGNGSREIVVTYIFQLKGVPKDRTTTVFLYQHPYRVIVTSQWRSGS